MIPEIDIWRTAGFMIRRYGDTADLEARICADEFGANGDRAGMRSWLRILVASNLLRTVQPGELRQ